jgi:tetratricopeptide (TPR) repeat protein
MKKTLMILGGIFAVLIVAGVIGFAVIAVKGKGSQKQSIGTKNTFPNPTTQQDFNYSDIPTEFDISGGVSLRIREMLEKRMYNDLNNLLHKYQVAAETNPLAEDMLFASYEAFRKSDPRYEGLITDWIAAFPNMYQPYLARAEYYYNTAWEARGTKWATETTQEQFQGMNTYFEKIQKDLTTVLNFYNKTIVPFQLLINIANTQSNDTERKKYIEKAIEINPATYKLRATYILSLTPRWGGSYKEMEAFANDSLSYATQNHKLQILPGLIYDDQALIQVSVKSFNVAEQLFKQALSYGENHVVYFHRGRARYKNDHYTDAITDLNRAIEIYKDDSDYYYYRALTYSKMEQYNKAIEDIIHAETLKNNDQYYSELRQHVSSQIALQAHKLDKNEKTSEAIHQYDIAIGLDPDNAILHYNKAISLYNNYQLNEALEELKQAIKLDPNEINFYIAIDEVLMQSRDWNQIIEFWDNFISKHPNNSRAYLERSGAYHHKGDENSAISDLETAARLGNQPAKQLLKRYGK